MRLIVECRWRLLPGQWVFIQDIGPEDEYELRAYIIRRQRERRAAGKRSLLRFRKVQR